MNLPGNIRISVLWMVLLVIVCILIVVDLLAGSVSISLKEIVEWMQGTDRSSASNAVILREFRIPRVVTGILAGAALSVAGLMMQTVFRNPLAGPYVLGISSGAGLGVALVVLGFSAVPAMSPGHLPGNSLLLIAAAAGSGFVLLLLLLVSTRIRDVMTILILGVLFGSAVSAVVAVLQYFSDEAMLKAFVIWTLGSLSSTTPEQTRIMAWVIGIALLSVLVIGKKLTVLLLGEELAVTMGMNLYVSRVAIFLITAVLVGTVTAFCGPVGFIGIIVPHLARMITGTSHPVRLLPWVIILGPILLLISDILAHLPGEARVLPINAVTAILGIPVIIWMVIVNRKLSALI